MKAYGNFWYNFVNYKASVLSPAYFIHQQINIPLIESWSHLERGYLETNEQNEEILIDEYYVRVTLFNYAN
jgi:hypothetical protein